MEKFAKRREVFFGYLRSQPRLLVRGILSLTEIGNTIKSLPFSDLVAIAETAGLKNAAKLSSPGNQKLLLAEVLSWFSQITDAKLADVINSLPPGSAKKISSSVVESAPNPDETLAPAVQAAITKKAPKVAESSGIIPNVAKIASLSEVLEDMAQGILDVELLNPLYSKYTYKEWKKAAEKFGVGGSTKKAVWGKLKLKLTKGGNAPGASSKLIPQIEALFGLSDDQKAQKWLALTKSAGFKQKDWVAAAKAVTGASVLSKFTAIQKIARELGLTDTMRSQTSTLKKRKGMETLRTRRGWSKGSPPKIIEVWGVKIKISHNAAVEIIREFLGKYDDKRVTEDAKKLGIKAENNSKLLAILVRVSDSISDPTRLKKMAAKKWGRGQRSIALLVIWGAKVAIGYAIYKLYMNKYGVKNEAELAKLAETNPEVLEKVVKTAAKIDDMERLKAKAVARFGRFPFIRK